MKIWMKAILGGIVTFGALFAYSKFEEKKDLKGSRSWSELCDLTDCERFPAGHLSFVMTNGDVLYTKSPISGRRCCGVEGKNFYDPDTDTAVVLDGEKVHFYDEDFREMGVRKYNWPDQAVDNFFASTEKALYGKKSRENAVLSSLYGTDELSLNIDGMNPILATPDFLLYFQAKIKRSAFSVISRDPIFFEHRISVTCRHRCSILSFDFEEGPGKVGLRILNTWDHTIPGFTQNCNFKTQTIQTCPAFVENVGAYKGFLKDVSALYAFLKLHPDERASHVRN